jgi:hypothetical protein
MPEPFGAKMIERFFTYMTEWCVTQIVAERNSLSEILVKV